jgi:hypothetical protein
MRTAWALSLRRLGASLLAVMLCAVLVQPAQAITSSSHFTSAVPVTEKTAYTGILVVVVEPCTGLFGADNPVDNEDPSGKSSFATELGKAVHKYISEDFQQKYKEFAVTGKSVATALDKFGINIDAITALFPDLVDINPKDKEVYEIKPAGLASFAAGELQLQGYLQLFNHFDKSKGWEAGFHYTPPISFVVTSLPWVPPTPVVAVGPICGVIQYATLSNYVKTKARNTAVAEGAEEEESVLSGTLTTLMGALF